jgi:hypothetical protein
VKKKETIEVQVFYPETKEGIEELKNSQGKVMVEILEKQLGENKAEQLFKYLKIKSIRA